jgi:hypothetical protein
MKRYTLCPYTRLKAKETDWAFDVKPYSSIKRREVVERVRTLYPQLKINRVYTVKSIKRNLVVLETDSIAPWRKVKSE